jgi:HlyD family secretion protein
MTNTLKQLFILLTKSQRKRFYILQFLVIIMAFTEIVSVASIVPFMTLVGDINQLGQDTIVAQLYQSSGITSEIFFVFLLGVCVLIMLFTSALISIYTTWKLSLFAVNVGAEIADRLYVHYLKQSWIFHASHSSAHLTKKVAIEAQRVTNGILIPLMSMNARIALGLFMGLSIFVYDPKVAIIGLSVFGVAYFFLIKIVRARLQQNGKAISKMNEYRFRLMNEGFGGIKDLLLLGRDKNFIQNFNETGKTLAYSTGTNAALATLPRYFMELIAFGTMISLILYLIVNYQGNLAIVLPIISVYALAGFKLLPAFQQIYASLAAINANKAAFDSIKYDLKNSKETKKSVTKEEKKFLKVKEGISLQNITFTYPKKEKPALKKINMTIPVNKIVGIVGPSGSGKSTLIDIILGLIEAQQGCLKIDNVVVNNKNRRSWQNTIGFVAQDVFLTEGTIAQNVAFGIQQDLIDLKQVNKALKLANLSDLLSTLNEGVNTKVGERGIQLSGGQRQRIGIARALYNEADVLVFDEATSSLDGITEKIIMDAIHNLGRHKTIVLVAHRLKTVKKCDRIYFMNKEKIVDQGTYKELIKKNKRFKELALHA